MTSYHVLFIAATVRWASAVGLSGGDAGRPLGELLAGGDVERLMDRFSPQHGFL